MVSLGVDTYKDDPISFFKLTSADFKTYLANKGIVLGTDQSAKTKTSLEFFSARLREKGAGV